MKALITVWCVRGCEEQNRPRSKMKVIGLTGGLACGKTTAARMFAELGAEVLDADKIAHKLMRPKTETWDRIVRLFGEEILDKDKIIRRDKLAEIVFGDDKALEELERIVHPAVINEVQGRLAEIRKQRPDSVVVIDAPLLIEAGLERMLDKLVVVKLDQERQIERAVSSGRFSKDEAIRRIEHFMPLAKKIEMADCLIDNNGSRDQTKRQIKKIWGEIQKKNKE